MSWAPRVQQATRSLNGNQANLDFNEMVRRAMEQEAQGAGFNDALAQGWADQQNAANSGYDYSGNTYAAPVARPLASSPEWLAYLNSLGLQETQFRSDIDKQRAMAKQLADQQLGDIAFSGANQRRQVAGSLESRGLARSGQFIQDLARQRAGEGRQSANVQLGLANTVSGLESNLSQKLMDLASKRAEQELSLRASGYT